ncbi:MAG: sodium:solute symporter family protein [Thermoguttaceae bacterium]|nr:sodium:solute symporter family protein [Thermoguttaceae bacterium]MDW8078010.1 sodium:solute symporter family protein [Thermoguttaceae bacterium]
MEGVTVSSGIRWLLGITTLVYLVVIYWLSFLARKQIHTPEDYVVAGRRLPLSLAWATILATWFGAGCMLTAADEVARGGLHRAALDPFGAGVCLLLAGAFFAKPLWRMKLLTICDFFARRFGRTAEVISAVILVPSYFGWVAAQFVALAGMYRLFFDIPMSTGILLWAVVGTGYTLLGGMWSVTLTDALQIALVIAGLIVLCIQALLQLGHGSLASGLTELAGSLPPQDLMPIDIRSLGAFYAWLTAFIIGALGNIPGQDLMQRIFAARSDRVAKWSCYVAGVLYLLLGVAPILLGLVAKSLFPEDFKRAVLPALAHLFLSPVPLVIFIIALLSAVLSTVDSAILSPAVVLAQNIILRLKPNLPALAVNYVSVLVVAAGSVAMAFAGETAYQLLEDAYALTLVGLFVPLTVGLFTNWGSSASGLAAMIVGGGLWGIHYALGWEFFLEPFLPQSLHVPFEVPITLCGALCYALFAVIKIGAPAPVLREKVEMEPAYAKT